MEHSGLTPCELKTAEFAPCFRCFHPEKVRHGIGYDLLLARAEALAAWIGSAAGENVWVTSISLCPDGSSLPSTRPEVLDCTELRWTLGLEFSQDTLLHNLRTGEILPSARTNEQEVELIRKDAPPVAVASPLSPPRAAVPA
jgi:hypothetical protein